MLFTDVIRAKRDGGRLSNEQIGMLVDGLADGSLPAEQVSALAMAVFLGLILDNLMTIGLQQLVAGNVVAIVIAGVLIVGGIVVAVLLGRQAAG